MQMDFNLADPQPIVPDSQPKLLIKLSKPFTEVHSPSKRNDCQLSENPLILQSTRAMSLEISSPITKKEFLSLKKSKSTKIKKESFDSSDSKDDLIKSELNDDSIDSANQKSNGKRVYTKRTTEKIRRWTKEESLNYEKFIEQYSDIFNDSSSKRVTKIFIFMADFIGTKTPSQCRSHHQKFFRRIQKNKLLISGKVCNDEEFEKLMPKKRKKKNGKKDDDKFENILNFDEIKNEIKEESSENIVDERKEDIKIETNENNNENNGREKQNFCNAGENQNNNGFEEFSNPVDNYQINNQEIDNLALSKMNLDTFKKNFNNFRKISMDDKEYLNLFNSKTRRKSSISMLFNNNYYYQLEPEFPNADYINNQNNIYKVNNDQLEISNQYSQNSYYVNYPPNQYNHHLYGNNIGQQIQNNDGITEEIITDMTKDENIEKNNNFKENNNGMEDIEKYLKNTNKQLEKDPFKV